MSIQKLKKIFLYNLFLNNENIKNGGDNSLVVHTKNFIYMGINNEELNKLKVFLKNNNSHFIIEKENLVNKYVAKYIRVLGGKVTLGVPHSTPHSTMVCGNTTIFIYYTNNDMMEYHEKTYSKIKSILSLTAIKHFINIRDNENFHFKVVFNNDPELAILTKNYLLKQIIQLQEKLCDNYGRRRQKIAIGVYTSKKIEFPVNYKAVDPESVDFVPLDFKESLNLNAQ